MSTYMLVLALGVLLGRRTSALREQVEPNLVFLSPAEAELSLRVDSGVLVEQLAHVGFSLEVTTQLFEKLRELRSFREFSESLAKVEKCSWVIRMASRALEEGRISPEVYRFIVQRYMSRLSHEYPKLENLRFLADEEVKRLAKFQTIKHHSICFSCFNMTV